MLKIEEKLGGTSNRENTEKSLKQMNIEGVSSQYHSEAGSRENSNKQTKTCHNMWYIY